MYLLKLFIALARQEEDFRRAAAQILSLADAVSAELQRIAHKDLTQSTQSGRRSSIDAA